MTTADLIVEEINQLSDGQQRLLLEFARSMSTAQRPVGRTIAEMQHLVGSIPKEDLDEMEQAIEEECERIDAEKW